MDKVNEGDIIFFIENNIKSFHDNRIQKLSKLKLKKDLLKRKNPYLFKAKNIITVQDLIKSLLDAYLSSQEEGLFGEFLEKLAIFICSKVYCGKKSSAEGIDLEFEKENKKYIISVKSGPNWGNSQQIKRMIDNFKKAKKILQSNSSNTNIICVNGCCYGVDDKPDKGDYLKLCGQRFWELISEKEFLYQSIIEPLGHKAKQKNEEFMFEYSKVINRFSKEFLCEFCNFDGSISWDKLLKFNSGKKTNNNIKY